MRFAFLLVVAGCGSPATYGAPIACDTPVASECPGSGCPTLTGELNNTGNCGGPASGYVECDGWTIISAGDMTSWDIYFKDGEFVAWIVHDHVAPADCTIGPASFKPPSCADAPMPLPVCH